MSVGCCVCVLQGERFINAYHNISNIILHISRKGADHLPAVLLVAHHDSPVASPGELMKYSPTYPYVVHMALITSVHCSP